MNHKNQEQKLKDLQLTLEKLEEKSNLVKHTEARKIKLDNGLYINTTVLNDSRNINDFNLKYDKDLMYFEFEHPEKTQQDFIQSKIEKINTIEAELKRKAGLSDDDFYQEYSNKCDIIKYKAYYFAEHKDTTEDEFKSLILRSNRRPYEPSEFENWHLTLYKRKLKELPKIKSNPNTKATKNKNYSFDCTLNKNQIEYLYTNYFSIYFDCNKEDIINLFSNNITKKIKTIKKQKRGNKQIDIVYFFSELKNSGIIRSALWQSVIDKTGCIIIQNKPLTSGQITTSKRDIRTSFSNETVETLVENIILGIPKQENTPHTL